MIRFQFVFLFYLFAVFCSSFACFICQIGDVTDYIKKIEVIVFLTVHLAVLNWKKTRRRSIMVNSMKLLKQISGLPQSSAPRSVAVDDTGATRRPAVAVESIASSTGCEPDAASATVFRALGARLDSRWRY